MNTENRFDKPLCKPDIIFTAECHPEANGRTPENGEMGWTFQCKLEDGTVVALRMGKVGRDNFKAMIEQEEIDDTVEKVMIPPPPPQTLREKAVQGKIYECPPICPDKDHF